MAHVHTIAKNTGVLIIGEIISKILSFITIIYIARYLGDSGLGKYSFVFAFVGFLDIFSDFGLSTLMIREISRAREKLQIYFFNIFSIKLVLISISTALPIIIINFIAKSNDVIISIYIVAVATFFLLLRDFFGGVFQAFEKMQYISFMTIIERTIIVVLTISFLKLNYGIVAISLVYLASYFSTFLISYHILTKNFIKPKIKFDFMITKYLFKSSVPFWFTALFISIYFSIDTLMLAYFKDYQVVGWYNASYKIINALYFIPGTVIMAVFPALSKFYVENKQNLHKLYKKSFFYLFSLGLPIGVGTTALADRIILVIYKEQFNNSIIALQILIWATVMIFISYITGYLLNAIDKQKIFTYIAGFSALLNVALNFILIPKYSYIGASIATVITEATVFIALFYYISKYGYSINLAKICYKPIIASVVMLIVIFIFIKQNLFVIITASAAIYFFVMFLLRAVGEDEIELIKSIIYRKT